MTKKYLHIVLCWLMLGNVLFISAGLDYCHNDKCHDLAADVNDGATLTELDDNSCIACSLDFFQDLYFKETDSIQFFPSYHFTFTVPLKTDLLTFVAIRSGRAPPFA